MFFKPLINKKFQEGLSPVRKEISPNVILNSAALNSPLPGIQIYKLSVSQENNLVKFLLSTWSNFFPKIEGEKEGI